MVEENLSVQKERPSGIKFVTYFHYLLIGIAIVTGVISIVTKNYSSGLLTGQFESLFNNLGIVVVLLNVLIISLICFFVGRGIWRGDKGARIIVIVISCIVFISQIFSIIDVITYIGKVYPIGALLMSVFYLIAGSIIFFYLLFNKKAKDWFKK